MALSKRSKVGQPTPKSSQVESTSSSSAETTPAAESLDDADRRKMISDAAYYRAQQRGFATGHELEDWLAAENEIVRSWLDRTSGTNN